MKHDLHDYLKLGLEHWKTIVAAFVFFGIGGGIGYGSHGYINPAPILIAKESKALTVKPTTIDARPCICQCGVAKHKQEAH